MAVTTRTALVTGASRGIGRAIAERLANDGMTVAVHFGSNEAAAREVVSTIEGNGGRAVAVRALLGTDGDAETLWAAFDEAIAQMEDVDGVDVLVNNAGVALRGTIEEFSAVDFDRQHAINARAPFMIVQQGLKRMRNGGRIINISSGVTRIAVPNVIGYAMTKGAIEAFTLTLAKHLGSRGITVNAVAPGLVDTDINASWLRGDTAAWEAAAQVSALGQVGDVTDIADVVGFLASPGGRWVTGQVIDATGGSHL